mgnify:CR=1 FL=1
MEKLENQPQENPQAAKAEDKKEENPQVHPVNMNVKGDNRFKTADVTKTKGQSFQDYKLKTELQEKHSQRFTEKSDLLTQDNIKARYFMCFLTIIGLHINVLFYTCYKNAENACFLRKFAVL